MKSIIFTFVFLMTMAFSANAQDGFFKNNDNGYRGTSGADEPLVPSGPVSSIKDNDASPTPLGSGLLIMTALGGAYLIRKKNKR